MAEGQTNLGTTDPEMDTPTKALTFRPPSSSSAKPASPFSPPSVDFFKGPWHVIHSTLPMWKKSRNVVITYTPLEGHPGAWDNLVEYQPLDSDKVKTVRGLEHPDPDVPAAWKWRGKGLLMIASSQWEVLGHGEEEGGWAVIFFQKTLFTPAGIDILARQKSGLSESLIQRIRTEMKKTNDQGFNEQADKIFQVKQD
jgi:hypothetical protein